MKTIEVTAQYKMGHTFLKLRTTLAPRNFNFIQEITEEIPDYADGVNSMISLPTGERLMLLDKYDDVSKQYSEAMDAEG